MPDLGFTELFTRQVVSLITPPGTLRRYPGSVLYLGRHGNLRIAHNALGTSTWTWGQVP